MLSSVSKMCRNRLSLHIYYVLCIFFPSLQEKHSKICQKSVTKRRKIFDSSRQRAEGTDLPTLKPLKPKVRLHLRGVHLISKSSIWLITGKTAKSCTFHLISSKNEQFNDNSVLTMWNSAWIKLGTYCISVTKFIFYWESKLICLFFIVLSFCVHEF